MNVVIDYSKLDDKIDKSQCMKQSPTHEENGKWYFWDETWTERQGPYETEEECGQSLSKYCDYLNDMGLNGYVTNDLKPIVHKLKSWSMFFKDILSGERTSDIRCIDDRRFKVGDYMDLCEWNPVKNIYTGRVQKVQITYIQGNKSNPCAISHDALKDNYVVLSIKKV